ncbi:replicative DNA helicase [Actinomycetota bacterium]|nr:replicative DNA helicase [Actinomycetota bacterium]
MDEFLNEPEFGGKRVPPQDINAEKSVIGALLLNSDAFQDVVDILKPEDFYSPQHQIIYEAEIKLFADAKPVDAITLVDHLNTMGTLNKVGGAAQIHDVVGAVLSTANIEYYANIVKRKSILRRMISVGEKITQLGYMTGEEDVQNIVDIAEHEVFDLCEGASTTDYVTLKQGMERTREAILAASSAGDLDGVPTGITLLDNYLHGLKGGQMIVVAARPAVGKSTLAMGIAQKAAIHNHIPTIVFNLEMAYPEIMQRILSAEKSIDHERLRSGKLDDSEWQRIEQFERSLVDDKGKDIPLYLDDSANMSLMQIRTKARRLHSTDGLGLIIVDYLQLMSSGGRVESRQQEVADISRKLKLLAKELNVPVIAISQLNRGSENRTDKKPQLSDLRESGAIEQDADVVILIHREEQGHTREEVEANPEKYKPGIADIIIAKNRAGRAGDFEVAAQMNYSRFKDLAREI